MSADASYIIGPADHLGVLVYDKPQISIEDVPVRPDGRISLPLVQDVVAAGRTPAELAQDVSARLSAYVKKPTSRWWCATSSARSTSRSG